MRIDAFTQGVLSLLDCVHRVSTKWFVTWLKVRIQKEERLSQENIKGRLDFNYMHCISGMFIVFLDVRTKCLVSWLQASSWQLSMISAKIQALYTSLYLLQVSMIGPLLERNKRVEYSKLFPSSKQKSTCSSLSWCQLPIAIMHWAAVRVVWVK